MIVGVLYVVVGFITMIAIAVTWIKRDHYISEDFGGYMIATMAGFVAGLLWPLTYLVGAIMGIIYVIVQYTENNKVPRITWSKK